MISKLLFLGMALTTSFNSFSQTRLLPDLVISKKNLYDNKIDTTTFPGRVLLRLSNGAANIGKGRLELRRGEIVNGKRTVYQRMYYSDGSYKSRFAGYFTYHPEHNHTHFDEFASYRLRAVEGSTGVGEILAQSSKVSFCLVDEYVYNSSLPGFRSTKRYTSCGSTIQGISVGWKDVYGKSLPDQWIDITGIPSGTYWLESVVDPLNRILERSGTNNTTRIKVQLDLDYYKTFATKATP